MTLHIEMQRYHLEVKGIPDYMNMLKDAQRQAGQEGQIVSNETLLLFFSTAMLTTERIPRANYDWEERAERDKTWMQWKLAYKKAHAQTRIKKHRPIKALRSYVRKITPPVKKQVPLLTIN